MSLVEDAFVSSADSISNIKADIRVLHENNLVDHSLKEKAASLKASLIYEKDQSSNGLPLVYLKKDDEHNHTQFVEVNLQGKVVYMHKNTAIWLFQDTERLSTDRIFRVRSKQLHESDKVNPPHVRQCNQ